jgi:hypothetical protein
LMSPFRSSEYVMCLLALALTSSQSQSQLLKVFPLFYTKIKLSMSKTVSSRFFFSLTSSSP